MIDDNTRKQLQETLHELYEKKNVLIMEISKIEDKIKFINNLHSKDE